MDSPSDVVRRFYTAMHAIDAAGLLATLDETFVGVVSEGLPELGGTYSGGKAMLEQVWVPAYLRFNALPHPMTYYAAGPAEVIVIGEYRGTVPSTGRSLVASYAHVFRVAGDKIVELQQITDTLMWAQALELDTEHGGEASG